MEMTIKMESFRQFLDTGVVEEAAGATERMERAEAARKAREAIASRVSDAPKEPAVSPDRLESARRELAKASLQDTSESESYAGSSLEGISSRWVGAALKLPVFGYDRVGRELDGLVVDHSRRLSEISDEMGRMGVSPEKYKRLEAEEAELKRNGTDVSSSQVAFERMLDLARAMDNDSAHTYVSPPVYVSPFAAADGTPSVNIPSFTTAENEKRLSEFKASAVGSEKRIGIWTRTAQAVRDKLTNANSGAMRVLLGKAPTDFKGVADRLVVASAMDVLSKGTDVSKLAKKITSLPMESRKKVLVPIDERISTGRRTFDIDLADVTSELKRLRRTSKSPKKLEATVSPDKLEPESQKPASKDLPMPPDDASVPEVRKFVKQHMAITRELERELESTAETSLLKRKELADTLEERNKTLESVLSKNNVASVVDLFTPDPKESEVASKLDKDLKTTYTLAKTDFKKHRSDMYSELRDAEKWYSDKSLPLSQGARRIKKLVGKLAEETAGRQTPEYDLPQIGDPGAFLSPGAKPISGSPYLRLALKDFTDAKETYRKTDPGDRAAKEKALANLLKKEEEYQRVSKQLEKIPEDKVSEPGLPADQRKLVDAVQNMANKKLSDADLWFEYSGLANRADPPSVITAIQSAPVLIDALAEFKKVNGSFDDEESLARAFVDKWSEAIRQTFDSGIYRNTIPHRKEDREEFDSVNPDKSALQVQSKEPPTMSREDAETSERVAAANLEPNEPREADERRKHNDSIVNASMGYVKVPVQYKDGRTENRYFAPVPELSIAIHDFRKKTGEFDFKVFSIDKMQKHVNRALEKAWSEVLPPETAKPGDEAEPLRLYYAEVELLNKMIEMENAGKDLLMPISNPSIGILHAEEDKNLRGLTQDQREEAISRGQETPVGTVGRKTDLGQLEFQDRIRHHPESERQAERKPAPGLDRFGRR